MFVMRPSGLIFPDNRAVSYSAGPPQAPQSDGNDYLILSNSGLVDTGANGEMVFAFYVYPLNGGTDFTIANFASGIGA